MSDITTGTIYKIICKLNHKFCYVGSTFDTLRNRWQRHKSHYRDWIKDPETKKCSFETLWICKTRGCCNEKLPVEYLKREKSKQYHQDNRDQRNEKSKQYHQNNRENIVQRKAIKVTCQCGKVVNKSNMARHFRSAKHQKYLTTQIQ